MSYGQELFKDKRHQRRTQRLQPYFREAATFAGLHLACRLPKCRRAKRCTGCWPVEEIATTHYKQFPPCVMDDATQSAINCAARELEERQRREWLAAGYSQEDLDRWEEEAEALDDDPTVPVGWETALAPPIGPVARKGR